VKGRILPDHADFAVAITVRERVLNDSILLSYHAGATTHRLAVPIPDGPPNVLVDFFLQAPRISTPENDASHLRAVLKGWGPLQIEWGGQTVTRNIAWTMVLLVRARFVLVGTEIQLEPEPGDVTIETWIYTPLAGAYPPDVDSYLQSGLFRNRLTVAVSSAIGAGLLDIPPIDAAFLGPIAQVANMAVSARVVDGAIVMGIDITSDEITTAGNSERLADFAGNNDIATLTNPVAVPITMQEAEQKARDEVAKQGATLERLTITAQEGHFRVAGRGTHTGGAASFSLKVVPVMYDGRPGAVMSPSAFAHGTTYVNGRSWPALSFRATDVDVDVDRESWVVIVEIVGGLLTGSVIPLIIEDIVTQVIRQIDYAVESTDFGTPVPRVRRLPPLVPGDPTVRLEIAQFEIHAYGVFMGITLRPEAKRPALQGLTSLPSDIADQAIEYRLQLPVDLAPDDPMLRIRWTVIDLDAGTNLINDDNTAAGRLRLEFAPSVIGPGTSHFGVVARVYRALGANITDFMNEGVTLKLHAPLPPRAYIRWQYGVKTPQLRYDEKNRSWSYATPALVAVVQRSSALHRVDQPCLMMQRRVGQFEPEFLHELPFPVKEILDRRDTLCEYCFFGGPGHLLASL
jgi:hypothetical protein